MTGNQRRPRFIDTHAHLDEPAFAGDLGAVLAEAVSAGVDRVVNVGYRPARWDSTIALSHDHPMISHMLGLHPHHADEWSPERRERLAAELRRSGAVALGEIGLDAYRDGPSPALQRRAFVDQIALATELALPIVIHQRAAEDELIDVLTATAELPPVVLHSFDAGARLARLAVDRGFFVGIGGLATQAGSAPLRTVLAQVPPELLLLETDSPYLVPAGVKGRRNTPAKVALIASRLAPIWNLSSLELAACTTRTAERLFGPRLQRFREAGWTE